MHAGVDINTINYTGRTPLHEAAAAGNSGTLKFLISRGADCYVESEAGETALQLALKHGIASDDLIDYFEERTKVSSASIVDRDQEEEIDELLSQVDAFELATEMYLPARKNKRRFLMEKIISFPKWLTNININGNGRAEGGGDREKACK